MGRIGRAVAQRAAAFGMAIAYTGRTEQTDLPYRFLPDLTQLAAEVDFLVLCLPGGEKTLKVVDARVLTALGPDGYLINIGRGSIVDEAALLEALDAGTIAGAALDVFANEPRVSPALFGRPNVVLTPHMASATHETRKAMNDLVFDNIAAHFAGEPLKTPVVDYPAFTQPTNAGV